VIADEHIGDAHHDALELEAKIEQIRHDDRAMVIVNGDLLNTALRHSVSDVYSEQMSLGEQIDHATKLLEPIKDKIIAGTIGNHEYRAYKEAGIDVMKVVFANLGISDRYLCEGGLIFIRMGQNGSQRHGRQHPPKLWYSVYVTHGSGGGRKEGGKANRLVELASTADADIYIHSHVHTPMIVRKCYYRADPNNCTGVVVDRLFVNTAASLNYGGYGQMYGYTPSSKRSPVITLNGERKTAQATL
jgi:predicted phosphodiesterase